MRKPIRLFIDQYGERIFAPTLRVLREEVGGGKISKMYRDTKSSGTLHVGYVVGRRWFTEYVAVERKA